ncbi:hypothetical protein Tco_0342066, partial [Tanacetum coccineum]
FSVDSSRIILISSLLVFDEVRRLLLVGSGSYVGVEEVTIAFSLFLVDCCDLVRGILSVLSRMVLMMDVIKFVVGDSL